MVDSAAMFRVLTILLFAFFAPAAIAAPDAVRITPELAEKAVWLPLKLPPDYSAGWFEKRYGITAPAVERQALTGLSGSLRIYYVRAASESDQQKLWKGLEADRTANQSLARKGDTLIWIVARQEPLRIKALNLLQPDQTATAPTGLEWLNTELGHEIPGLVFYDEQFLDLIIPLEERAGVPLRGVYQIVYDLKQRTGPGPKLAQVEFWLPKDPKQLPELVKALDYGKTREQTILSGKNAAVVTITRTDDATRILLDQLKGKGYRVESRVPSFAGMGSPAAAH